MADLRASVLLPLPLKEAYDYAIPAGMQVRPGDYVTVPLGPRRMAGVVWRMGPGGTLAAAKLRPIISGTDLPPMPEIQRHFIDWVAHYTMSPPGAVLRMALSRARRAGVAAFPYRLSPRRRAAGGLANHA